jgi:CBS domain-containing membrane protein
MLKVKDLMTREVVSLTPSATLLDARNLMEEHRIRHVPVVGPGRQFIGLVTQRDILSLTISSLAGVDERTQREIDAGIPLGEIVRTEVEVADPDDTVRGAAERLLRRKLGCLPVVREGILEGILTEADFLKLTIGLMDEMAKSRGAAKVTGIA